MCEDYKPRETGVPQRACIILQRFVEQFDGVGPVPRVCPPIEAIDAYLVPARRAPGTRLCLARGFYPPSCVDQATARTDFPLSIRGRNERRDRHAHCRSPMIWRCNCRACSPVPAWRWPPEITHALMRGSAAVVSMVCVAAVGQPNAADASGIDVLVPRQEFDRPQAVGFADERLLRICMRKTCRRTRLAWSSTC